MGLSTKLEDKLEGIDNFLAWKYKIGLILQENDIDKYVKEEVSEPEEAEAKEKHRKDMIRAQRIIVDSIKYHLIPQVSSKKTPKEMYDALSRMFEGRNINRKMNLRSQLKSIKMIHGESIQDYFSRVSQIKEKLEAIGDNLDEDEMVMTALNGLTRPWESFIQMMCARKESMKFDIVWEDCIQEETRVANREALLKADDQALATHTKRRRGQSNFKRRNFKESHPPRRIQRVRENPSFKDYSDFECFHCNKIGHIARNCPKKGQEYRKRINNNKRHHAHLADEEEGEGPPRKQAGEEDAEEYVIFSALSGSVNPREDTWLIDSGASNHMMGQKKTLSKLEEKSSPQKVSLGDDYQYPIKGVGEASYKLDSGNPLKMKDVLYVPGLKKNLLSISA